MAVSLEKRFLLCQKIRVVVAWNVRLRLLKQQNERTAGISAGFSKKSISVHWCRIETWRQGVVENGSFYCFDSAFESYTISVQFTRSVVSDCDPMNCSMPGLPVHHQLPESIQTHVGDVIQPSHPLSSVSPSALSLSQHQGLFK